MKTKELELYEFLEVVEQGNLLFMKGKPDERIHLYQKKFTPGESFLTLYDFDTRDLSQAVIVGFVLGSTPIADVIYLSFDGSEQEEIRGFAPAQLLLHMDAAKIWKKIYQEKSQEKSQEKVKAKFFESLPIIVYGPRFYGKTMPSEILVVVREWLSDPDRRMNEGLSLTFEVPAMSAALVDKISSSTASLLKSIDLPEGFEDATLKTYGMVSGNPKRAAVTFVVCLVEDNECLNEVDDRSVIRELERVVQKFWEEDVRHAHPNNT